MADTPKSLTTAQSLVDESNRIADTISNLQDANSASAKSIKDAQLNIGTNSTNIAKSQAELAQIALTQSESMLPATAVEKARIAELNNYITTAQQNTATQQSIIDKNKNNIAVNQTNIDEQQLYQERDQEILATQYHLAPLPNVTNPISPADKPPADTYTALNTTSATTNPLVADIPQNTSIQNTNIPAISPNDPAGLLATAVDPVTGLTPNQAEEFAGAYGYVKPTSDDLIAQAVAEQQARVAAEENASPTEQAVLDEINSTEARDLMLAAESSTPVPTAGPQGLSVGKDTSEERDLMIAAESATPLKVTDWRVRLSLAPDANYLYKAVGIKAGDILLPLKATNGVVFPYTPTINTNYRANYDAVDVTHSNYKLYFYKNSSVDEISLSAEFTAQDTTEANYLLAVIHFFKSVTKMFYGQDGSAAHPGPKAGTPPPLCYLSGYGAYQFDNHPLLISSFQYNLPNEVDYIRAGSPSQLSSQNLSAYNTKTVGYIPSASRLSSSGLNGGGVSNAPNFTNASLTNNDSTFVPTKMQIVLTMLPVVTRNDISNKFSLQEYATGKLLRGSQRNGGGIW